MAAQSIRRVPTCSFLRRAASFRRDATGDGFLPGTARRERLACCAKRRRRVSRRGGSRRHWLCSSGPSVFGPEESSRAVGGSGGTVAPETSEKGYPCLKSRRPLPAKHPTRWNG